MNNEDLILQKLSNIESLLNTFIYGTPAPKTTVTSNGSYKYILKPLLQDESKAHKEANDFTKELLTYAINKQEVKSIVSKYTNGKISSIPIDKLPDLIEDLSNVALVNACVQNEEIPF